MKYSFCCFTILPSEKIEYEGLNLHVVYVCVRNCLYWPDKMSFWSSSLFNLYDLLHWLQTAMNLVETGIRGMKNTTNQALIFTIR
jgi:hypothetical protein